MNKYLQLMTKIKQFGKNSSGQIAIMFAVLALPLATMLGAGIDWSQQLRATDKLQSTIDSAILAVARGLSIDPELSTSAQRAIAQTIFDVNVSVGGNVNLNAFTLTFTNDVLNMAQTGTIENNFLKLVDIETMDLSVASQVNLKFGGVDLALAVDLSGSMGGSKISHLRAATSSLLTELSGAAVTQMRVSFIPWTRGVNVGAYYDDMAVEPPEPEACYWRRNHHGHWYEYCPPPPPTPNDCIDIRPGGLFSANDTVINHPDAWSCPSSKLVPLTDLAETVGGVTGETRLKAIAATWGANGGTGSHNGIYWARATLKEAFWPTFGTSTPLDPTTVKKYAIIMTDGLNNA